MFPFHCMQLKQLIFQIKPGHKFVIIQRTDIYFFFTASFHHSSCFISIVSWNNCYSFLVMQFDNRNRFKCCTMYLSLGSSPSTSFGIFLWLPTWSVPWSISKSLCYSWKVSEICPPKLFALLHKKFNQLEYNGCGFIHISCDKAGLQLCDLTEVNKEAPWTASNYIM